MGGERHAGASGRRILAGRLGRLPERLRETAAHPRPPLDLDAATVGGFAVTGIGSSGAHARFLVCQLAALGLPARFLPLSELAAGVPERPSDVLVVFSQGLSPNARIALAAPERWRRVILATAARQGLEPLEADGVRVFRFEEEDEFGTLLRIVGPLCGFWAALDVARAIGAAFGRRLSPDLDVDTVASRVEGAAREAPARVADLAWLDDDVAFFVSGSYGELVGNLPLKLLEGWLRPAPPVYDLLEFAHGPFQEVIGKRRTFLALARAEAAAEAELLERVRRMIEPEHHRLVVLPARLPSPFAVFEHEAMLDAICLRYLEARGIDPTDWPGRHDDRPLYGIDRPLAGRPGGAAAPDEHGTGPAARSRAEPEQPRRLDGATWPEIGRMLDAGRRTAVLPLGATEQHGPHLPLSVDTTIADALAERFCARVPGAVPLPALAVGCSPEHLDFPGTLSLRSDTLAAVLEDLLRSLRRHGFERAFLFTAHGGNVGPLRAAVPRLVEALAPFPVAAFLDLGRVTRQLADESLRLGAPAGAAGHHAGEIETSILLALDPAAVRRTELAPGRIAPAEDARSLFYPSLRPNAENGTIGDPSAADPARAARYLEIWTGVLVEVYRSAFGEGEKNVTQANGTQKP